jgi:phosphorylase kinase alpha/beta subunit
LGYNESKTQASTPGHRTPGGASSGHGGRTPKRKNTTFYGKSLASPLDRMHEENYFDELANALNKLKANAEPEFKLKAHEDKQQIHQMVESPMESLTPVNDQQQKTGSVPSAAAKEDQSSSPYEMLSLTLGDSSQFNQAVESLAASVNLYDQIG